MKAKADNELIEIWGKKKLDEPDLHPYETYERVIFERWVQIAKSSTKILDVGAGEGRMVKILQKAGVSADFYSLDITERVKLAPEHRIIGDARMLPFKENTFDLVYSLGVVEHFPETGQAIREHARVVKEGGYVLINTPHFSPWLIYNRLRFFVGKKVKGWQGDFVSYVGKHLTRSEIVTYFTQAGLKILYLEAQPPVAPFGESVDFFFQRVLPPAKFGKNIYCLGIKQE